ncbi:hypothetical protein MIMGU_mgv1a000514mg [Erythranthe guttata]|uniref:Rad21/Rec8-like protein N-terminal domain-containing protein n=1 Tax=Erythranthe guttata TaxID=4155 RepID=A0A022RH70_ERYGU|nr:hypothetical protein MIMGU_mgv1a000514mg [Erythranthe guttata]
MFYSQFILAKKGPLGTIWIAAHLERKLRKNQVADTDIGVSVDSILSPDVPIALRLSSHLLLGVVRIYNRKVNYLFDDCSEALLKVKQAFRSAAVDLPPEESKAPYHSITLPETFDLDDFELPDNDLYQGNFVDHHISSREQITLQDNMASVSYSTSKFGFDERFGDGDTSGLDLDEVAGVNEYADLMEYAQAPSTPGLVEEPNLTNIKEVSACDDHMELEYSAMECTVTESAKNTTYEDNTDSDAIPMVLNKEYEDVNLSERQAQSPIEAKMEHISMDEPDSDLLGQIKNPSSELADKSIDTSDIPCMEDLQANKDENVSLDVSVAEKDQGLLGVEVADILEVASDPQLCPDALNLSSKNQDASFPEEAETLVFQEPIIDSSSLNLGVLEKDAPNDTPFLRACNSKVEEHDIICGSVVSADADVESDVAVLATSGRETTVMLAKAHFSTDNPEEIPKENQIQEHTSQEDVHAVSDEPENANSNAENLNNSAAPEKMLSVPEGPSDLHINMLVENTPGVFTGFDEGDSVSKIVSGKKRSFTESTLTEQSLNSVESSRLVRFKRTVESVPDDDDLLSSILVGRTSVLKLKPTPRLSEVTSMKRTRSAPRTGAPKRKVLMDDMMVLHGDSIRQQLTNTEDIRRVRKKAPCTLPEISVIQRQYLEDEIFLQPIFTGMSIELVSLHSKTHDLSRITICKSDPIVAPIETVAEPSPPSENVPPEKDEDVVHAEIINETVLTSHDVQNEDSHATATEPHLTSENAEIVESEDLESGVRITNELLIGRDSEVADQNPMDEVDEMNVEINTSEEQINPTSDMVAEISQEELLLVVTGEETRPENDDPVNSSIIGEPSETNPCANVGMPAVPNDEKMELPSAELDSTTMYFDSTYELTDKDGDVITAAVETEPVVRDDDVEPLSNAKDGELENKELNEMYNVMSEQDVSSLLYPAQVGGLNEDDFMNNGENQEQTEAYQGYGFDLHNQEDLEYSAAGIDTEFLNVDDDELNEVADDDNIPDNEEALFTSTTGWSSRTRAVSKYLQTLFVKEAERGRKSLSMENLLVGKSRKEASRMFFEALVLKTRDHIHVEQQTPFDDITIKPRSRMMKYDF